MNHTTAAKQIIVIDTEIENLKKINCFNNCINNGDCLACFIYKEITSRLNNINSIVSIACK